MSDGLGAMARTRAPWTAAVFSAVADRAGLSSLIQTVAIRYPRGAALLQLLATYRPRAQAREGVRRTGIWFFIADAAFLVGEYPAGRRQRRRPVGSARRGCWVYAAAGAAERRGAARGIGVGSLQPDPVSGLVGHRHTQYGWKTTPTTMEGQ